MITALERGRRLARLPDDQLPRPARELLHSDFVRSIRTELELACYQARVEILAQYARFEGYPYPNAPGETTDFRNWFISFARANGWAVLNDEGRAIVGAYNDSGAICMTDEEAVFHAMLAGVNVTADGVVIREEH